MGSYNRLNGTYACQHPGILSTLKRAWGWEGFVAPDFLHAVRDPAAAANTGLDIPGLGVTEGRTAEDFASGRIPSERLDEIVRRILFSIFDAGLDQHRVPDEGRRPALASTAEHLALASGIATDGMVLLSNHDGLLPLDAGRVGSVAVIGTAGDDAQWVMAGSPVSGCRPPGGSRPWTGSPRAGDGVRVGFTQGSFGDAALPPVPAEVLTPPDGEGTGLLGEYWNGETPDGAPALTVVDPAVDIPAAPGGLTAPVWSARWTGTITPTADGPHRFTVLAAGNTRLEIDGSLVAAGEREFGQVFDGPALPVAGMVDLRAGRPVGIRLDYSGTTAWPVLEPGVGGGNVRLGWQPPDTRIREAAVLFGDADPGGRLPVTFPATGDQGPITGPDRWPGVDGDARYDEGVLVGYRWFDEHGQEPRFCFGHGLSYGDYEYGQPHLTHDEATGTVTVAVQVTNVGDRGGVEVVQRYVAAPPAARQPPRQLKDLAKVHLDPGASQEVILRLDHDDLAAFDEASGAWVVHPGRYLALVGRSSRDLRGQAGFEVGAGTSSSP